MHGPQLLVRTLSTPVSFGKSKTVWQYHSRSDRHSKAACWGVMFDFLATSAVLRRHVADARVVFGVNHEMREFKSNRKKDLDLVVARPAIAAPSGARSLPDLVPKYGIVLDSEESALLASLPCPLEGPVGSVLVAMEAKACMTVHSKSLPRFYDELNSSHQTIHGAADNAVAVGLAMINSSPTFISPGLNPKGPLVADVVVSTNPQRRSTEITVAKVRELPKRDRPGTEGFDALGIVVVMCANDGSPVLFDCEPPAPDAHDSDSYDMMIHRLVHQYESRFGHI